MTPLYPFAMGASELGAKLSQTITRFRTFTRNRLAVRVIGALTLLSLLVLVAAYFFVKDAVYDGAFGDVPSPRQLANITTAEASRVLSSDGRQLGKYYLQERVTVARNEIAPSIVEALVATEDARYFKHAGYDLEAWARVLVKTVLNGDQSSGGGSTLSQQLVKNLYGRSKLYENADLSLVANKVREIFVACDIEEHYSKDDILALYLNTVAFPDNTYGIGVAARRYFDKAPSELLVEEAATLVGSLKATYTYDPIRNPRAAFYRRNTVLDLMEKQGYLTAHERDSLQATPLRVAYHREEHNQGLATHFREHARLELKQLLAEINAERGTDYDLYHDGLLIETTIDAGMQAHAERAVTEHLAELQTQFYASLRADERPWEVEQTYLDAYRGCDRASRLRIAGFGESYIDSVMQAPLTMRVYDYTTAGAKEVTWSPADSIAYCLGILNAGFLAVEPSSGAVRAWVGGNNHEFFKYDKVSSRRSVGSTFKPIVYAAALKQGIDPARYWGNYRRSYAQYEGWSPRNSGDEYGGQYNMRGGLTNSLNTISVQLMMHTGPKNVVQLASDLGIESKLPAVPAIALGAGELSLKEMIQAYSVFANRGVRTNLRYIERIRNRNGEVIYDAAAAAPKSVAVLSTEHADLVRGMLESVVDNGTGRRVRWKYKLDGAVAGKTGTSQNHSDGWFIGFTPRLLAGAWTGAESPAVRFRDIKYGQGAHMALPVWGRFMSALQEDERYAHYLGGSFPKPDAYVNEVLELPMRYVEPALPFESSAPIAAAVEVAPEATQPAARSVSGGTSVIEEETTPLPSRAKQVSLE